MKIPSIYRKKLVKECSFLFENCQNSVFKLSKCQNGAARAQFCLQAFSFKMSSSSSDSEEENFVKLREVAEVALINDNKLLVKASKGVKVETINAPGKIDNELTKSERYLDESDHHMDLQVPKSMQDILYRKLSENITKNIEFVEPAPVKRKLPKQSTKAVVKLLRDTEPIKRFEESVDVDVGFVAKQVKPKIEKRNIEKDDSSCEEKIRLAVIDPSEFANETSKWRTKRIDQNKFYEYRKKNSILYLVEPNNEFSSLRKKNNWSESKIAKWKRYQSKK